MQKARENALRAADMRGHPRLAASPLVSAEPADLRTEDSCPTLAHACYGGDREAPGRALCASITCMNKHYVARRAKVIFDHPHNAADRPITSARALHCTGFAFEPVRPWRERHVVLAAADCWAGYRGRRSGMRLEGCWMRAVVVSEFGGPEQLLLADAADPVPGEGHVRVAVHAAGANPVDAFNRADGGWAGLTVPCILGYDVAGVVESLGRGVTGLAIGDRVMAMTHFPDGGGGYAELAVVHADLVARIDAGTSFADAAATPLAAGTADVVLSRLALHPGDRLLVLGASGGVGLFLLQLAADRGIEAIAVGRRVMHDQMLALGAASCIDYTSEDVAQRTISLAGGPVDAVADLA